MKFSDYLENLPKLHSWDGGKHWSTGGFQAHHLRALHDFLSRNLRANPRILETGAGNSSITFLFLHPEKLISIAPDRALFTRINDYCIANGIDTGPFDERVEYSQWALPLLASTCRDEGMLFDFVLIDGCHGWPTAFVDLEYGHAMLKQGGYLMLDDINIHAVKEMARFLKREDDYELAYDLHKSLVFKKKTSSTNFGEWTNQRYIIEMTRRDGRQANPFSLAAYSTLSAWRGGGMEQVENPCLRIGIQKKPQYMPESIK